MNAVNDSYWRGLWREFCRHKLGMMAFYVVMLFCLVGVYAPFLASSKPFVVYYDGAWFFPLFRYLFYPGFFTKRLDIFFNLLIFALPIGCGFFFMFRKTPKIRRGSFTAIALAVVGFFIYFAYGTPKDPAADAALTEAHQEAIQKQFAGGKEIPDWKFDLRYMTPYQKLNLILRYQQMKAQNDRLQAYSGAYAKDAKQRWLSGALHDKKAQLIREGMPMEQIPDDAQLSAKILQETDPSVLTHKIAMPTLWQQGLQNDEQEIARQKALVESQPADSFAGKAAQAKINYLVDRRQWLETEAGKLQWEIMPLIRPFHWEDDAGGEQSLNHYIGWSELTRINRKDLIAALIFGVRISLVVGTTAVALALIIGIPVGAFAGFYGGTFDIVVCRMLEIWESMPTFFMLLLVVAMTQSKSIFLVIAVIGLFGWSGFSRYIRGEFFKQRNLSYVEACRAMGFGNRTIMFSHILPNAIPPLLTLLPFAIMEAITSEAGLSFLGLGEEGSCSWGVLMDEGRTAFPGESYLLWPPAILLTILLVAIALVGDTMRDVLDPKMRVS